MSEKIYKCVNTDQYFHDIVEDIINNKEYLKLKGIPHHNSTDRYNHCIDVAYRAYKLSCLFNVDTKSVVRGALLHDFYVEVPHELKNGIEGVSLMIKDHPKLAYKNAKKLFKINDVEADIILTHMFPMNLNMPKHKESWLVSLSDKLVSFSEVTHRYRYSLGTLSLFFINWLYK